MKNSFAILSFSLAFLLTACAQTKTGIQNTYAFFIIAMPGNIPVDDNGNPLKRIDTLRTIYIETTGRPSMEISSVQYGSTKYDASIFEEETHPVVVGYRNGSNKRITLRPKKGNSLWRVELTPSQKISSPNRSIIIKGTVNGRTFTKVIAKEVELAAEIRG